VNHVSSFHVFFFTLAVEGSFETTGITCSVEHTGAREPVRELDYVTVYIVCRGQKESESTLGY